jgi:hypothetical protein
MSTVRLVTLALAASAAVACRPGLPETAEASRSPQVPQYSIEDFMGTTRIGGASFSPDATTLIYHSNQTGVFNLYEIPAGGGTPSPPTSSTTDAIRSLGYFPLDRRVLYRSDKGRQRAHARIRPRAGRIDA